MISTASVTSSSNMLAALNNIWGSTSFFVWDNYSFIYQNYWTSLVNYSNYIKINVSNTTLGTNADILYFCQLVVNNVLLISLFFIFLGFLANQGVQIISSNQRGVDLFSDSYGLLSDIDDEVGAIDDIVIYGLMFAVIVAWYFFFTILVNYLTSNMTWFIILLNFIFLIAALLPLFVLYSFGGAFPIYVRGVGKSTSIFIESFLDIIAIGVMFSRFLIQNFRLVLVFAAFFELSEYIYVACDFTGSSLLVKLLSFNMVNSDLNAHIYWYDWVSDFLTAQILLIYYWGHLVIVFISQLINYFLLSFYLFYFLYTTFVFESHEKYLFHRRALAK